MKAALSFARLQEEKINEEGRRNNKVIRENPSHYSTPRRLTKEEIKERMAKGLCWHCDEKWHRGHQCKQKRILMIEPIENSEEEDDFYEGPWVPITNPPSRDLLQAATTATPTAFEKGNSEEDEAGLQHLLRVFTGVVAPEDSLISDLTKSEIPCRRGSERRETQRRTELALNIFSGEALLKSNTEAVVDFHERGCECWHDPSNFNLQFWQQASFHLSAIQLRVVCVGGISRSEGEDSNFCVICCSSLKCLTAGRTSHYVSLSGISLVICIVATSREDVTVFVVLELEDIFWEGRCTETCALIMVLGRAKIHRWKDWEKDTTSAEYAFTTEPVYRDAKGKAISKEELLKPKEEEKPKILIASIEFTNLKYSRVEIDEVRFEWAECMLDYI
ncbi:hypothetical protein ZIOFF_039262 [Zingiber officinale]|uniref:Uncharacterized protein n=1 Tax=Zingiber officinale TaxID=94328 RepID=A0A8J5GAZ8_ZINOF|nr:hypothetical protein ZIOFF_039262 [Zingiber officinale]